MRSKLIIEASLTLTAALLVLALALPAAGSMEGPQAYVDVWTDRGDGEIYSRGDGIDVFVESSFDAYVIVYSIDTDGYINVLFPYDCRDDGFLRGGKTYRIVSGRDDGFLAEGSKGVAYVRAVASATPFRRLYWPGCPGYERYADSVTWASFADYWGPALPPRIYGDPYIAMQSIDEFICWDSAGSGAVSVDYDYYYVMERVERPVYFVSTGWRWPHTWYGPCWSFYWDACWDVYWAAGWSVNIRLGHWDPYLSPYNWSWCAPTWCAPSWCYPGWYRPHYAYCGPRTICCRTGTCGSCPRCTGRTTRTYPSQIKYKSGGYAASGPVPDRGTRIETKTKTRTATTGTASRERATVTPDGGSTIRYKRDVTDEDRDVVTRVRQVSEEAVREPRENAAKSKTSGKVYSTETRKTAVREVRPVEVKKDNDESTSRKSTSTRSYKTTDTEKTPSKAVTTKKSTSTRTTTRKTTTNSTTTRKTKDSSTSRTKVSEPKAAAPSSSARPSKASSSSSGSSRNHRGSP